MVLESKSGNHHCGSVIKIMSIILYPNMRKTKLWEQQRQKVKCRLNTNFTHHYLGKAKAGQHLLYNL